MALAAAVVLEGIRHGDRPVAEELAVHLLDRCVRALKRVKVYEGVALGPVLCVPRDLGIHYDLSKGGERV